MTRPSNRLTAALSLAALLAAAAGFGPKLVDGAQNGVDGQTLAGIEQESDIPLPRRTS